MPRLAVLCVIVTLLMAGRAAAATARRDRSPNRPPPPYFGTTVSPGARDKRLTIRVKGKLLPVRGRWFSSGNIRWRVFPVRPIVAAMNGELLKVDRGVAVRVCGREAMVRWAKRGRRPRIVPIGDQRIVVLRPRWPLRAGAFSTTAYSGFIGETNAIWLYRGEILASDGWLMLVMGLRAEPYGPEFSVIGCAGDAHPSS